MSSGATWQRAREAGNGGRRAPGAPQLELQAATAVARRGCEALGRFPVVFFETGPLKNSKNKVGPKTGAKRYASEDP